MVISNDQQRVNTQQTEFRYLHYVLTKIMVTIISCFINLNLNETPLSTSYSTYNGYSHILDIVILLSLSIFPHLHIRHAKFIAYSDNLAVNVCPQRYHYIEYRLYQVKLHSESHNINPSFTIRFHNKRTRSNTKIYTVNLGIIKFVHN